MSTQDFIHSLEQGRLAKWVIFFVIIILFALGEGWFVFWHFRGLSEAKGMDQAQIAREIASGDGFSTKNITPLAYAMFKKKGAFPLAKTPDIYEAPLNPMINSVFLGLVKKHWAYTEKDLLYVPDQVIASLSIVFLGLGIAVNFLTASRVFDSRIAGLATGLVIVCNRLWEFTTTGLPQLLMFFIFSCALYVLFRAIEARRQEKPVLGWLSMVAFLFGLLALAHALAIWIFVGLLVFTLYYFVPRGQAAVVMLAIFMVVYAPWLARNYKVCGNPFGLGYLSVIGTMDGSESDRMRSQDTSTTGLGLGALRSQMRAEFIKQTSGIYGYLGGNPMAPVFFVTLLYVFKRKEAGDLLWCVFLMLLFAFCGMCISGADSPNDLYILFTPVVTLYGFAYVMMLWARLEFNIPILRYIFIFFIYLIAAVPLLANIMNAMPTGMPNWPPYSPSGIAYINKWTLPNEIVASDQPWAVAWYGNRKSLLIPGTMDDFLNFCDWTEFSDDMEALYLTPITGDQKFVSEVIKGGSKDWAPYVSRSVNYMKSEFPFHYLVALPSDNECSFYAKNNRWAPKTD